jgi:hypothetical protein
MDSARAIGVRSGGRESPSRGGDTGRPVRRRHYIACRWDYHATTPAWLHLHTVKVSNRRGATIDCIPVDWGPNARTGRIADMSPGAAHALGLQTNDTVEVDIPMPGDHEEPKEHGLQVDTPPLPKTVTPVVITPSGSSGRYGRCSATARPSTATRASRVGCMATR